MPNVLKAGKLPEKVADIYRGTCKSCGAIVEFGVDELVKTPSVDSGKCPTEGCAFFIRVQRVVMRGKTPISSDEMLRRTKSEVLAERENNPGGSGCCERYANKQACSCLEFATDDVCHC